MVSEAMEFDRMESARELALKSALMELHHALVLISYGCEELLTEEIGRNRAEMLAALVLAEEALREKLCLPTPPYEDDEDFDNEEEDDGAEEI